MKKLHISKESKDRLAMKALELLNEIMNENGCPTVDKLDQGRQDEIIENVGDMIEAFMKSAFKVGHDVGFKAGKVVRYEFNKN
jgi:predicted site-specific integrase-resolvase